MCKGETIMNKNEIMNMLAKEAAQVAKEQATPLAHYRQTTYGRL